MIPLSNDPKDSGSDKYCSNCFVNGKLLAEEMTLGEFQKKAYTGMVSGGHNKVVAWIFSKMIRFAPYWKNK
jgi:hypothetical protein